MPRFRPTARLLVLDPAGRVLLFSAADPRGTAWFTPGGGVHRGASLEAAAGGEVAAGPGRRAPAGWPWSASASLTSAAASSFSGPLDSAMATARRSADSRSDGRATAAAV